MVTEPEVRVPPKQWFSSRPPRAVYSYLSLVWTTSFFSDAFNIDGPI